jgi:hypothetical protein
MAFNPIVIKSKIDLLSLHIRRREDEQLAVVNIWGQVLGWIKEKGCRDILNNRGISILQNKLIYYISKEIHKNNPNFILTTGWYRYGPCFEQGRHKEESFSLELLKHTKPEKEYIDPVKTVCEEHIPIFEKDDKYFPREYLSYIYSNKVDFDFLKYFYPAKHELWLYLNDILQKKSIPPSKINEALIKFDSSILDKRITNKIGILKNEREKFLDFTSILGDILTSDNTDDIPIISSYYNIFDEILLGALSYKVYESTLESPNLTWHTILKEDSERNYQKFYLELDRRIQAYFLDLS